MPETGVELFEEAEASMRKRRGKATMPWNYRIAHFPEFDASYQIVEAYYHKKGDLPHAWCEAAIGGETLDEVKSALALIGKALDKPVIEIGKDDEIAGEIPNPLAKPTPRRPERKTPNAPR